MKNMENAFPFAIAYIRCVCVWGGGEFEMYAEIFIYSTEFTLSHTPSFIQN